VVDATRHGKWGAKPYVIAGLVLLVVAFVWWRHSGTGAKHAGGGTQAVGVASVTLGSMPVVLDELGTVTPTATVTVLPQISGYLTEVAFTEGQNVVAGQFLAQIDPRPYQIQLEQDQAALAKDVAALGAAQSDLARYQKLAAQDSISAQEVTDAQYTVAADKALTKTDQANIDTARLDLSYCHITAPVAGRVGLRLVDAGNYVTPGSSTGLAVVTTVSPTSVEFSVAQSDLAPVLEQMAAGATLTASAYASDDVTKIEDGVLTAVDNQMDASTGMVKLRATFANANEALFPNEFVNLHLLVKTEANVPVVPASAVQNGAPGDYVYVVKDDDTVHVQPVTTGPGDGTNIVITKGLNPGDVVVVDGVDRLTEGAKVSVVKSPLAPTATAAPVAAAGQAWETGQGQSGHHHHHAAQGSSQEAQQGGQGSASAGP
jgi:multidrug efflux system membrane fusion protein